MLVAVNFADKEVLFSDHRPSDSDFVLRPEPGERIGRAKVLKILENHNSVAVLSSDPAAVFGDFASDFACVEAAGGVVADRSGAWLMIFRNGRWDLPKGHWEPGETLEQCAVREVGEETGAACVRVVRPLCDTLHAYWLRGRWELKRTHWYEMRLEAPCTLRPQREEGIERVAWCPPSQLEDNLRTTFPTIRRVMACVSGGAPEGASAIGSIGPSGD